MAINLDVNDSSQVASASSIQFDTGVAGVSGTCDAATDAVDVLEVTRGTTFSRVRGIITTASILLTLVCCLGCGAHRHPETFDLAFPAGYGVSRVTVGASDSMSLRRGDHIRAADGSPGVVTNTGDDPLIVGSDANIGTIVSTGRIVLGRHVTASVARSSAKVELGAGDSVGSVQNGAVLTPLASRSVSVNMPTGKPLDLVIKRGSAVTLPPGRYGALRIGAQAVVTVSAGTYLAEHFSLGPQAELRLNTDDGSVLIYAERSADWDGVVSGDASRFVFGFLGRGLLLLKKGFRGTALAPYGSLKLARSPTAYQGTFYAKHVSLGQDVTIEGLNTPLLVDGLNVSKATPCVGELTEVSADISGAGSSATAWIQGVVGSHQFVQFSGAPGPRLIWATVYTPDGRADFASVPITLQQCVTQPGAAPPIALHFWHALSKPNVVELIVHDYDANGHEIPRTGSATYAWSFGDGQTTTTNSPLVSHDYTKAINPMAQFNYFDVSVSVTGASGTAVAKKVVPIWSLYAKNRAKGIVQPPNTLSVSSSNLSLAITNYEPAPISLTQANVELIPCDPALDSRAQPPQALSLTVPAGATVAVNVAPPSSIANDVCSIGVHVMGSAGAGRVYTDAYMSLKENPLLLQAITDSNTIALLNHASGLTKDPNKFDEFELRQLYAQGAIPQMPSFFSRGTAEAKVAEPKTRDDPPVKGGACTPGDVDPSPLGLVCEPTGGWVFVGPEIMNAFKGNFIMDHGCGFIGVLLSSVGQLYSHTSTVVKNRVAVRHSTASGDRMQKSINYLSAQLDPDKIKYAYPGTAGTDQIYTIEEMVEQYCVAEPSYFSLNQWDVACDQGLQDSNKQWRMGGELNPNPLQCDGDQTAVQPLVIRPAPDAPANVLQGVASVADHTNVNSHYRFFHYSRADLPLSNGPDWGGGATEATVCSSFNRLSAVEAGLRLHPSLKTQGVPDGMQKYLVPKRIAGGNTLFSTLKYFVLDQCEQQSKHQVSGYCLNLAGNIARQITNCFADDGCNDPDGTHWANPGVGIAVSPEDMLDWDTWNNPTPTTGGTYGYGEPLVYQPLGYRHAYAWAAPQGSGTMTVKVVHTDSTPYQNATVLVNSNAMGTTDKTGTFQIPIIAAGTYEVGAQFDPCAQPGHPKNCTLPLEQASTIAVLPQNGSITVPLTLCAGPVVNGVVTSCPQPGSGPSLNVSMTETQTGPDVCFTGSGYTPSAPVQITYSNVPGRSGGGQFSLSSDNAGNIKAIDTNWEGALAQFCNQNQVFGQVTVTAHDVVSDVAIQSTVPSAFWCPVTLVGTNFNGGCH